MTMHLVRGMTTINTKKRKRHITKAKMERWEKERRAYNKDMKRLGMHTQMTMEEYIYCPCSKINPNFCKSDTGNEFNVIDVFCSISKIVSIVTKKTYAVHR